MSSDNLWQICHKNTQGNNQLTKQLVMAIRRQNKTSKQVAGELVISTERVRNWYYRNTGMTAKLLTSVIIKFLRQNNHFQ